MDNLKKINDTFGHQEGSQSITIVADVLRKTFRESDIVGRIGGDEFAILAANVAINEVETVTSRLEANLATHNVKGDLPYPLSLSLGAVLVQHDTDHTMEELMVMADAAMYRHKRGKRQSALPTAVEALDKTPVHTR